MGAKKLLIFIGLIILGVGGFIYWNLKDSVDIVTSVLSPLDAVYMIDGREVSFKSGLAELETAPGASQKEKFVVFGQPVSGDMDGDADADAGLLLSRDGGGSGIFYYAVIALNEDDTFTGTNAIFLGDRIAPQTFEISNEIFTANYAVRKDGEPMTVSPSVGVSKHMTVEGSNLADVGVLGVGESLISGSMVYGHEARSITPCGGEAHWIMGSSTVLDQIKTVYENKVGADIATYKPVFATVIGKVADAPIDGFGADYNRAVLVLKLVRVPSAGACR